MAYYPPGAYPYGTTTTTTTTYVTIPTTYVPATFTYATIYDPWQPFALPIGLPPHLAEKMLRASQIFRTFDLNHSGSLDYFEWRNAMNALGYYMTDFDAARLFAMIDRDHSGRISEREFCEFWVNYGF